MVIRLDRNEFMPPVEFALVCISTQLREYRLAHLINTELRMGLCREDDLNAGKDGQGDVATYPHFLYDDGLTCRTYSLIGNRPLTRPEVVRPGDLFGTEETQLLMPELAKADYLLLIYGDVTEMELADLCDSVRLIPEVMTAYTTDPHTIKDISPIALI